MPIGVNHSPGYSQYGQAMYDSSRNVENYDRYQKLMELLMQRRQMEQQQQMQEAQLSNQNEMQQQQIAENQRQFDISRQPLPGNRSPSTNSGGIGSYNSSSNQDWLDRTRAFYASKGIRT